MNPLVWWTIPAVATAGAIAWNAWTNRTRGPADPYDSVREFERVRSALSTEPRSHVRPAEPTDQE